MKNYGKEVIIDLHNCNATLFTRKKLQRFFEELCNLIDMEREALHWWDYEGLPEEYAKAPSHLKGISAVQFIKTSNIVVHTLDELRRVYINIFSCKEFSADEAKQFSKDFFEGVVMSYHVIIRK